MQLFRRLSLVMGELQKLPSAISHLTHAIQDQRRSARTNEQERRTFEGKQERIERSGLWASWAAVAAATVYAFITKCQFSEMKKQTDANFNGQAGWLEVLVENVQITGIDIAGNRAAYTNLWIRDRGLSPVTKVNTSLVIRTISVGQVPSFTFDGPKTCQEVGIIYPDHSKSEEPDLAASNNAPTTVWLNNDANSIKLPDCEAATIPALQPAKQISPVEYQQLIDGKMVIVAYGKTLYTDIYKRRHTEFMCRVLPVAEGIASHAGTVLTSPAAIALRRACLRYNDIDPERN